ncbi:MAG TPA: ABC transporter permease, partial [Aggregatilineales bacterium]|nr:ABC transporter permease [Aggregatilineales bacterium]
MLSKIIAIAWTHFYIVYTDRGALILMLLIPVALSTIIGLAFGQVFSSNPEIETARILVINQDEGTATAAGQQNLGDIYVNVLTANDPDGLGVVLEGETGTNINTARDSIASGDFDAALIIPPDFSEKVTGGDEQGSVELIYNPGDSIAATIINSVVDGITAQLNAAQVAQDVLIGEDGYFIKLATAGRQFDLIETAATEALTPLYSGTSEAAITRKSVNVEGEEEDFDPLKYFAPAMAIMFMTFAMAAGTRGILEEQQNWTLQRLLTTPTPRWVYMIGKLLGTYASGIIQMLILLVVTPVIAVLLGRSANVWGDNYIGLAVITLAVVGAATGVGVLLAAISATPRQADNYANAILVVMAMLGGTFVPVENVPVLSLLSNVSLNKWGLEGYTDLAINNASIGDILPAAGVLLVMTVIFFGIALVTFNRRL